MKSQEELCRRLNRAVRYRRKHGHHYWIGKVVARWNRVMVRQGRK